MSSAGIGVAVSTDRTGGLSKIESLKLRPVQDTSNTTEKVVPVKPDSVKITNTKGEVPVKPDFIPDLNPNALNVAGYEFTNVREVIVEGKDLTAKLEEAKEITNGNKIDEVYFKNEEGKLFVAYGSKDNKGSLEIGHLKEKLIGVYDNKRVKIVHIDNEINTAKEGAISPFKTTWKTIREAGETGIVKGIGEIGTTVVALFVGKSLIQNGITAAQQANNAVTTATAVGTAVNAGKDAAKIVEKAGSTGKAIFTTVKSGLSQVAVGAIVAGAVIGTVAGVLSVKGAYTGSRPRNDYTTIEMVTNPNLAFKDIPAEKK